jgi:hypothetical protein
MQHKSGGASAADGVVNFWGGCVLRRVQLEVAAYVKVGSALWNSTALPSRMEWRRVGLGRGTDMMRRRKAMPPL